MEVTKKKYPAFDISSLDSLLDLHNIRVKQEVMEEACWNGFPSCLFLKIEETMIYLITHFFAFFTGEQAFIIICLKRPSWCKLTISISIHGVEKHFTNIPYTVI